MVVMNPKTLSQEQCFTDIDNDFGSFGRAVDFNFCHIKLYCNLRHNGRKLDSMLPIYSQIWPLNYRSVTYREKSFME